VKPAERRNEEAARHVQSEFSRVEALTAQHSGPESGREWYNFLGKLYAAAGVDLVRPIDPYKALTSESPLHQWVARLAPNVDSVAVIETRGKRRIELTSVDRSRINNYEVASVDVPDCLGIFDAVWADGALPAVLEFNLADQTGLLQLSGNDGGMGL
jgi:hypothetical protein